MSLNILIWGNSRTQPRSTVHCSREANSRNARQHISKTFYQQLRSNERKSLVSQPESMREYVVAASKAMRNGDWLACMTFINEKTNAKAWDLFYESDKVRDMLTRLIQEDALRTYHFTFSHVYNSISMPTLAEMFELDKSIVHSTISKMIINEELMVRLTMELVDFRCVVAKNILYLF